LTGQVHVLENAAVATGVQLNIVVAVGRAQVWAKRPFGLKLDAIRPGRPTGNARCPDAPVAAFLLRKVGEHGAAPMATHALTDHARVKLETAIRDHCG